MPDRLNSRHPLTPEVRFLHRIAYFPHSLKASRVHVKEVTIGNALQVEDGSHVSVHPIHVLVDKHVVVITEDRVVQSSPMQPEVNPIHPNQRSVVGQRHSYSGGDGVE